ncbi:MAG: hypothetical protein D6785_09655 [Planctomycetota bacterium]|nr:MAG: hypothetical protein D6785_09655 [Planctomycetota bacterium]
MEEKKRPDKTILVCFLLLFILFCWGSYEIYLYLTTDEKERIRQQLMVIRKGCAEGDWQAISDVLAPNFKDHLGHTGVDIRRFLMALFYQQKRTILFDYLQIDIKLAPNKKKAKVFFTASRRQRKFQKNPNPEVEGELEMIKKDGEWLILYAKYKGVEEW